MGLSVRFIAVALICLSAMALPCPAQQPAASANPADHDNQFCTIAGTILSANAGEPLKKAQVTIYRDEGDNEPHPQTASSDASGHFSIDHLAAGRYELRVSRVGYLDTQYGQDKPDKPGAVLTLIAGQKMTTDISRASAIEVKSGDEVGGIDIVLSRRAPSQTYRIHGRVVNSISEHPDANVIVTLAPRGRSNEEGLFTAGDKNARPNEETGEFEIQGVASGEYLVIAVWFEAGKVRTGTQSVDVIGSDVRDVSMLLTRGIDISGRVTFEGKAAASASGMVVSLSPFQGKHRSVPEEKRRSAPTDHSC